MRRIDTLRLILTLKCSGAHFKENETESLPGVALEMLSRLCQTALLAGFLASSQFLFLSFPSNS